MQNRKLVTICAALILSAISINNVQASNIQIEDIQAKDFSTKTKDRQNFSLYVNSGYRTDNLKWDISGFNQIYNIGGNLYSLPTSSELSWKDIKIVETRVGGYIPLMNVNLNYFPDGNLFLHGTIAYGKIVKGKNQDSDFLEAGGKKYEFSRSDNNSKSGSTQDYSLSVNYKMPLDGVHLAESKTDNYSITPIVGYELNQQNLTMTDGNQTIDLTTANKTGSFSGLDSSYKTSWQGPFLGLSFNSNFNKKHDLEISGEYHIVDYSAEGNWNLRTDLAHPKSFEHNAQGSGRVINVKYSFKPGDSLSYSIALNYKRFETDAGNDRTFFSNGQNHDVRMDKAKWDSKGVNLGVGYEF